MNSQSLLGGYKMQFLLEQLWATKDISGDIAEIGVYRGGSAFEMCKLIPEKKMHLYDTFTGVVKSEKGVDVHGNGDFADTSLENVKELLKSFNCDFNVGIFPDTFIVSEGTKFSFVHSDTDTYFGTRETLKVFEKRMSAGGKIIFDDYKWVACPGVEKAISEFLIVNKYRTIERGNQFVINF
jgi:O-methyltransferase